MQPLHQMSDLALQCESGFGLFHRCGHGPRAFGCMGAWALRPWGNGAMAPDDPGMLTEARPGPALGVLGGGGGGGPGPGPNS